MSRTPLKETINAKIEEGYEHFVLNLDNVKIIDSCGVGLIIVANNVTSSRSCKLYLSNIKPFIVKIFEIMRISKHLARAAPSSAPVASQQCQARWVGSVCFQLDSWGASS